MFSRNADLPAPPGTAPVPGVRDVAPPPTAFDGGVRVETTTIARADRFEGTLKVSDVLRVLGSAEGTIETTTLLVEEGARVAADVTADEAVISGDYEGRLVCRQRLEVRPSGRVSGHVETARLMLHEGAEMDGDMKMLKPDVAGAARPGSVRGGSEPVRSGAPAGSDQPLVAPLPPGAEPIG